MHISVAICTWNRAELLDRTLAQMHLLRVPDGVTWELLVVNNNCTDDTDDVINRHAAALPLRRIFEEKQGHSHARNCAIDAARGDLLIWTDDDVLVDEHWLEEYARASDAFADACYFGGPIEAWFETPPPGWMTRHWADIQGIFVLRDFGADVRRLSGGEIPAGANMAFRMDKLRSLRFDDRFGRVGATLTGADDTDFLRRVREAGHQGVWVGTARVKHFLPSDRLTKDYVRRWFQGAGRTHFRQKGVAACPRMFGFPRWALWRYSWTKLGSWLFAPTHGEHWFLSFREAANLEGFLSELRMARRHQQSHSAVTIAKRVAQ